MTPTPVIRIQDVAFVHFSIPDLALIEAFLTDFGLSHAARTDTHLFMRGTGPAPFLYMAHTGQAALASVGFRAGTRDDLERLAQNTGSRVVPCPWPGGGEMVKLTDPNGYTFNVIAGQAEVDALPAPAKPLMNDGGQQPRIDAPTRVDKGPSVVKRLGHVVLNVKSYPETRDWLQRHFGMIVSDEIRIAGPGSEIGAFMRCDRGATPTDHHTIFIVGTGTPKFNHAAFEVAHADDLMRGHYHLKDKGATHEWGVGRHILGSQIFDYWRDPFGHALEHWTDGDLYTAGSGSRVASLQDLIGTQWGPEAPPTMG